jgi:putative transposase
MDNRVSQRKETKKRRSKMDCRVFELKLDRSKMSKKTRTHLSQLFTEAKWFYNYCLSMEDLNDSDTTAKTVPVKVEDRYENRKFQYFSSQMKQGVKTRLFNSLSSLKALKEKGHKVGRLKFKSRVNSIPLKQYDVTYQLDRCRSMVKIQGLKRWLKVSGLRQIPYAVEIANANLVRKADDFYLKVTTFSDKKERLVSEASIGIDFGCETQLTFSDGTKVEFQVPVSKRLRRLDRKIMRNDRPDSKKKNQDRTKRQREYNRISNRKKDIRHKIVHAITSNFRYVCFQDESIHAWQASGHGRKIQNSGIGGIISDLKNKSVTPCEVPKFFPSTKLCPSCGSLNRLSLGERTYRCDCGFERDRDWKSASCIEAEGLIQKRVPVERRDLKVQESSASAFIGLLSKINGIRVKASGAQ